MTKSPIDLVHEALAVGQEALPIYASKYSRKDFTPPNSSRFWYSRSSSRPTTAASSP